MLGAGVSSALRLPKDDFELQGRQFTVWPVDRNALARTYPRNENAVGLQKGLSSKQCGVCFCSSGCVVSVGSDWVLRGSVGPCKHVGGVDLGGGAARGAEENVASSRQSKPFLFICLFWFGFVSWERLRITGLPVLLPCCNELF